MKRFIFSVFLSFLIIHFSFSLFSQNQIDSLILKIEQSNKNTIRLDLMISVADAYFDSSYVKSFKWYSKARELAIQMKRDSNVFLKAQTQIAYALRSEAWLHFKFTGNYDSAFLLINQAIAIYENLKNSNYSFDSVMMEFYLGQANNSKGTFYYYKGDYSEAIRYYQISADHMGVKENSRYSATAYLNIGNIYYEQKSYGKAIDYYKKSMAIKREYNDQKGIANILNNIGSIYYMEKKHLVAIEYFRKSMKIRQKLNDEVAVSKSCNNIGVIYRLLGNYDSASYYYNKSLVIKQKLNDRPGILTIYGNLLLLNISLADSTSSSIRKTMYLKTAEGYGLKAMKLAEEIDVLPEILDAADNLYSLYKAKNDAINALKYAEIRLEIKDSLFSKEKTDAIAELEAKYETKQKQIIIDKQELLLSNERENVRRKSYERNTIFAGLLLVIILLVVLFRSYKQKQRNNILINEKNHILEQANAEIGAQRDEIERQRNQIKDQRDKVTAQKDEIEKKNTEIIAKSKEITDSITYASRIQNALFPSSGLLHQVFCEHFILYKPRNIVSGDFYWVAEVDSKIVYATADCTGHGVPGAFMSMLGITFLNEIVKKEQITDPAEILNNLREKIIDALRQRNAEFTKIETKDGIDIALCTVDIANKSILYSGARNSLYIVRDLEGFEKELIKQNRVNELPENAIYNDNKILIEYKANRMPVGVYLTSKQFDNKTIIYKENVRVYTFTDGYMDQFGGLLNKKLMSKRFKELILESSRMHMIKQYEFLKQYVEKWINDGNSSQGDDILILGIKL